MNAITETDIGHGGITFITGYIGNYKCMHMKGCRKVLDLTKKVKLFSLMAYQPLGFNYYQIPLI